MRKTDFTTRVYDSLANEELKVRLERIPGNRGYQIVGGKYASCAKRIKAYESVLFEEKDLRGLSTNEKNFIRENGYKNYYEQTEFDYTLNKNVTTRYYIFIKHSLTTNKPTLYAYHKMQWIDLGNRLFNIMGKGQKGWNYEYWLVFNNNNYNRDGRAFSKYNAEYRFGSMCSCVNLDF